MLIIKLSVVVISVICVIVLWFSFWRRARSGNRIPLFIAALAVTAATIFLFLSLRYWPGCVPALFGQQIGWYQETGQVEKINSCIEKSMNRQADLPVCSAVSYANLLSERSSLYPHPCTRLIAHRRS